MPRASRLLNGWNAMTTVAGHGPSPTAPPVPRPPAPVDLDHLPPAPPLSATEEEPHIPRYAPVTDRGDLLAPGAATPPSQPPSSEQPNPRHHMLQAQRGDGDSATPATLSHGIASAEADNGEALPTLRPQQADQCTPNRVAHTSSEADQEEDSPPPVVPPSAPLAPSPLKVIEPSATLPPQRNSGEAVGTAAVPTGMADQAYRPVARSASPAAGLGDYDRMPLCSVQSELQQKHRVVRLCLTGGPCAGKSTMLAQLLTKVPQQTGYHVYCVPEAATMLVTGGMQWDSALTVQQQLALIRIQLALEDQFYAVAMATGKPGVVISDRGALDGKAFCSEEQFGQILKELGCTTESLRSRYDAVLHMVTAAIGAEAFYSLDNPARYEDLDGARASDEKLRQMYVGHPYLRILDNSTSFEEKIERGLSMVCELLGQKTSLRNTSYYVLRRCPLSIPIASASCEVTTTVLSNSHMDEIRLVVQRAMPDGSFVHFFKCIRKNVRRASSERRGSDSREYTPLQAQAPPRSDLAAVAAASSFDPEQRIESGQRISTREYCSLLKHRDPLREDVIVQATHFLHEEASFEVMTVLSPSWARGRQTMTVDCEQSAELRFPAFVEVDREVPMDSYTTSFLISHRETGPLYTSLAFAPVFSRHVAAIGAHADVENILRSTHNTSRMSSFVTEGNSTISSARLPSQSGPLLSPTDIRAQQQQQQQLKEKQQRHRHREPQDVTPTGRLPPSPPPPTVPCGGGDVHSFCSTTTNDLPATRISPSAGADNVPVPVAHPEGRRPPALAQAKALQPRHTNTSISGGAAKRSSPKPSATAEPALPPLVPPPPPHIPPAPPASASAKSSPPNAQGNGHSDQGSNSERQHTTTVPALSADKVSGL